MSSSFTSIRLESIHGAGAVDRIFEKQVAIICEFPSEMAEPLRKKRLTLNLSFLSNLSESKLPIQDRDPRDCAKSTRNFERELVGLGIVAAMSDYVNGSADTEISVKISRTAILAVSPRSHPVPITDPAPAQFARQPDLKFVGEPLSEKPNMKLSESYTCVISNIGNNLIKKREYFNDSIVGDKSGIFFASPPRHGKGYAPFAPPRSGDFLHSCHLCKKTLQGLDIFMYRGDKAFCSADCRAKQMASHEWAASDCSAFPCTGTPLQLLPEVAAA